MIEAVKSKLLAFKEARDKSFNDMGEEIKKENGTGTETIKQIKKEHIPKFEAQMKELLDEKVEIPCMIRLPGESNSLTAEEMIPLLPFIKVDE